MTDCDSFIMTKVNLPADPEWVIFNINRKKLDNNLN